jgi:hypothetical protein
LEDREVNFTDKTKLVGGTGFTYNSVVIRTGGYGVNGNATHDADIRVGQDGALIEYSSSSSSYVSGGGAGGTLNRGVCQCYEQFRRKRGGEWCGRGANCVAGTVGGQNTGGGGGGGGASSDEANIDCIDGYSGGSGRVIVWCDKYIVTDTLYNTSLSVSDLSSTHYPLNIQTITNLLLSSTRLGFQTRRVVLLFHHEQLRGDSRITQIPSIAFTEWWKPRWKQSLRSIRCIPRRRKRQL